jgi:hypothetical protein
MEGHEHPYLCSVCVKNTVVPVTQVGVWERSHLLALFCQPAITLIAVRH